MGHRAYGLDVTIALAIAALAAGTGAVANPTDGAIKDGAYYGPAPAVDIQ
jgi:hypothetical protein